jgi:hypothetical protein
VGSVLARFFRFGVVSSALVLITTSAAGQGNQQPAAAPAPVAVARPNGALHGEYLYESAGYVIHKPVNYDREFFEITPEHRGQAIFIHGAVAATVDLKFHVIIWSPTQPGVFYWVFKEEQSTRMWAFQANGPSAYGYGIFANDSGNPFSFRDWLFYDYSRRTPEL